MAIPEYEYRQIKKIKRIAFPTGCKILEGIIDDNDNCVGYKDMIFEGVASAVIVGDTLRQDGHIYTDECFVAELAGDDWWFSMPCYCFVPDMTCKKCHNHMKASIKEEDLGTETISYKCVVCGDNYIMRKGRYGYDSLEKVE